MVMKNLRRAAVVLALVGATTAASVGAADAAPPPTPQQKQAVCIAKETLKSLREIDRKVWRDRTARDAAVRDAVTRARKSCPLPGPTQPPSSQTPTQRYAALVSPTATEVVDLGDGTFEFRHGGRSLPADTPEDTGETVVFSMTLCPSGWTATANGLYTTENPSNQGYLGGRNVGSNQFDYVLRNDIPPPNAPLGITYAARCRPPSG